MTTLRLGCDADMNGVEPGTPCTSCGETRRQVFGLAHAALGSLSAFTTETEVGFNPARPWQQKWRDLRSDFDQIEGIYRSSGLDSAAVRLVIETFFARCRELADWIDQLVLNVGATAYVRSDVDLRLCDGLAQSTKHRDRLQKPPADPISACVASVRSGQGMSASIDWSMVSGSARGTEDARDLARRCVDAWERFFVQSGLNPDL